MSRGRRRIEASLLINELAREAYFYLITSAQAAGEALIFIVCAIRGMECIGHITSRKYCKEYNLYEVRFAPCPLHTCIQYSYMLQM